MPKAPPSEPWLAPFIDDDETIDAARQRFDANQTAVRRDLRRNRVAIVDRVRSGDCMTTALRTSESQVVETKT